MENQNINFKEFDSFIQKCLDKYFYVEPWKKLYERTGKFHRDIISDKPTIPDLIIYNKYFNKSFCFYESNQNSYIRFPRMRFILRPKFKKEYNPIPTYGKDNEILLFPKKEGFQINKDFNYFEVKEQKESDFQKEEKDLIFESNEDNTTNKANIGKEEEEEEEDPEWANDKVDDYFNREEIKFKAIPKSIEDKANEENEDITSKPNTIIKEEENSDDKININIDNFFSEKKEITFEDIDKINDKNKEKNNFIKIRNENEKENNFMKNKINNNSKKADINFDNIIEKNELKKNSNEFFDAFDEKNKYKNLYLEDENSDNNNSEYEIKNNRINNNVNINELKIQQIKRFIEQNKNNIIANNNLNNFINTHNNTSNFKNNKNFSSNQNHIYNINNNNILFNLNNINYYPHNNNPNVNMNINNIPYNNSQNFNNPNNAYMTRNNNRINYSNKPNININSKETYVKNLNNMIHNYNTQNMDKNNLINNLRINQSQMYNNLMPMNYNVNNIQRNALLYNSQLYNNYPPLYNNINNNLIRINSQTNQNQKYQNNINNEIQNKFNITEEPKNNQENTEQDFEPLDFSDNPYQILIKNINQKKWLVIEKDKNNYILNYNTKELFDYLKGKNKEEFKDLSINDSDTDYFFPADEIYENLKKFYSYSS